MVSNGGPYHSGFGDDVRVGLLDAVDDVDLGDDDVGQGFLVVHFDEAEDVGLTEAGMHLVDPRDRLQGLDEDRKSTRLNSSHSQISYAVFCLKKKTKTKHTSNVRTT